MIATASSSGRKLRAVGGSEDQLAGSLVVPAAGSAS